MNAKDKVLLRNAFEYYAWNTDSNLDESEINADFEEFLKNEQVATCSEWVSVEERLPEESECILGVEKKNGNYDILTFEEGEFISDEFGTKIITHWQPLPLPPKAK